MLQYYTHKCWVNTHVALSKISPLHKPVLTYFIVLRCVLYYSVIQKYSKKDIIITTVNNIL